jgi:outer membrane lipoprotein-sorting protein
MENRTPIWLVMMAFLAVTALAATAAADEELGADEIIERTVERNAMGFEAGRAQVVLTVFDRAGEQRERQLDVRSRRDDDRSRTLMSLTAPAEVRGQAFLFVENPDADDDMWMYLPAFEFTRRVEGRQRRSSFLGSHFTFADLESRDLRESEYTRRDDDEIGGHQVYVIEARPKNPQESDYQKVVAFVRKSDFIPLRVRFYDKSGDLEKTLFAEELADTDEDVTYIRRMSLHAEAGGYTRIEISGLDTEVELPDSLFDREEFGR